MDRKAQLQLRGQADRDDYHCHPASKSTRGIVPHSVVSVRPVGRSTGWSPGGFQTNGISSPPVRTEPHPQFDPRTDDFVPKERRYLHFDIPLTKQQRAAFSASHDRIASHAFYPLLGFTKSERRRRQNSDGTVQFTSKDREIRYGAHIDSALLSWFARELSESYEAKLRALKLEGNILAYREGMGTNISMAGSLFSEIRARGSCVAIALDLSKFFDTISHNVLSMNWKAVMACERLPKSHFKVFERMTKYEWVDLKQAKLRLGASSSASKRLCTPSEFRSEIRRPPSIIRRNCATYGIPQGSPMSGLLANISMLDFDRKMKVYLYRRGGSYRRYSDDIAIVLPTDGRVDLTIKYVERQLKSCGLKLNASKTERSTFSVDSSGQVFCDRGFQYLGFVFDGRKILIRSSSLNRYYKKMKKGVRGKVRAALRAGISPDSVFLRELMKRYTHFGRDRNFVRYAHSAAKILNAPEIRRQISRHMRRFNRLLVLEGVKEPVYPKSASA